MLTPRLEGVSSRICSEFIPVRKGKRIFLVFRDADGLDTLFEALGKREERKIRPSRKEGGDSGLLCPPEVPA